MFSGTSKTKDRSRISQPTDFNRPTYLHQRKRESSNSTSLSPNPDYTVLQKSAFKYGLLQHHIRNWKRTPRNVLTRIYDMVGDIHPPLPLLETTGALLNAGVIFGEHLTTEVRNHCGQQLQEVLTSVSTISKVDVDRAVREATRQLRQRLGEKFDASSISFDVFKASVDVDVANVHVPNQIVNEGKPPMQPLDSTKPITPAQQTKTLYSVRTHNSFDALMDENNDIVDPTPEPRQSNTQQVGAKTSSRKNTGRKRFRTTTPINADTTNKNKRSNNKQTPNQTPATPTLGNQASQSPSPRTFLDQYSTPQPSTIPLTISPNFITQQTPNNNLDNYEISEDESRPASPSPVVVKNPHGVVKVIKDKNSLLKPNRNFVFGNADTEVVVLGDSNLKKYTSSQIPSHWSVVSIPGVTIKLVNELLIKSTPNKLPNLKHLIIAVGINDRDNAKPTLITDCLTNAQTFIGPLGIIHFQGIPINKDVLRKVQITNLETVNNAAAQLLTTNYIEPPTPCTTTQDGVHYLQDTLKKILSSMISHITKPNLN